jgi:membrane associated rhomboid family serine protease
MKPALIGLALSALAGAAIGGVVGALLYSAVIARAVRA